MAALFGLPLVVMAVGALRPPGAGAFGTPASPSLGSLLRALELVPLGRMAANSLVVAVPAALAGTVCASWAAFAVARSPERIRRRGTGALLLLLMVPPAALWMPRVLLFRELGVLDTYVPLLVPALVGVTPLGALLCLWSFRRVPVELWEAAAVEGAGLFATWRRVALPLTAGTHVAVAVIAFAVSWGAFVEPLLYLSTYRRYTLPLGLRELQQLDPTAWPVMLAGALVATLPVVVGFAFVQRWFVRAHMGAEWLGR